MRRALVRLSEQIRAVEDRLAAMEDEHGRLLASIAERSMGRNTPDVQQIVAQVSNQLAHAQDQIIEAIQRGKP